MTQATSTVTALRAQARQTEDSLPAVTMGFNSLQSFELMQRGAKLLTASDLVPQQFRGNLANCVIALNMANRIGADPLMVMQNLYVVHGSPSWSSKFLIATINTCGRFSSLRYEWRGKKGSKDYGCRAWAIEKATGERLDGIWVDWEMVEAEGWSKKNGSKWKTMADQMFVYRAAAFWQRAYAPELGMGLQTREELDDVVDVHPDGTYTMTSADLRTAGQFDPAPPADVVHNEGSSGGASAFDIEGFKQRMQSASDLDTLDAMADELRELPEDIATPLYEEYGALRNTLLQA
ncbi:hypothetical protein [Ralstonia pickettii]|uniref:hypothetical protein n=1 Tax=Ralstonia pickettii TaxID=329 RepID=UPI0015FDD9A4|nr:hypothetical protein [Ralstonia pickettii]MBB0023665.1 hypothetical protein [Ralstonia pickettii]MBB0096976.1 hypothetical protein [Ralstonia pickettii]MBB0107054.1 hypothetical protein [Ralstonia pickettii]MBB0127749.1 hypothetical protein [Ralstonia pickettii]MBB0160754.1 hypothetical protein [Ralstonia pickettii]